MNDIEEAMSAIWLDKSAEPETREAAKRVLQREHERQTRHERADRYLPDDILPVDREFEELCRVVTEEGRQKAAKSHVTIVGQVRDCGGVLPVSLHRLSLFSRLFAGCGMVFVENDSKDGTKEMLKAFAAANPENVVVNCRNYGYKKLAGFEPKRVKRYAAFRNKCKALAKQHFPETDYVLVVDLDPWGGWSLMGLINGIGWLERIPTAAGMASLSLYEASLEGGGSTWLHYDLWALRAYRWRHQFEPWMPYWLPSPGAPPVRVLSAFGAAAIYRPKAFFACDYESIDGDIEHAGLHKQMQQKGWEMYLNPSQRVVMHWLTE